MNTRIKTSRRDFLKKTAVMTGAMSLAGNTLFAGSGQKQIVKNPAPKWKGFNLQDFFSPDPGNRWEGTTGEELKWMADWGFNFVRIPMAYPSYLDIDRTQNIKPDDVYRISGKALERVDNLVYMAHKYNLHVSLNLHRAPGYCINAGFHEPFNLWKDKAAQEAFYWHWTMWAKRYKSLSREKISFDLLNEPAWIENMNDQHSSKTMVPGDIYAIIAEKAANAIWEVNPDHMVIADGNDVGTKIIPGLAHLPVVQSCRGYFPMIISHYKAGWAFKDIDNMPELKYPGEIDGKYVGREILEEFYKPWIELVRSGVGVHCGECGCYNKTPHEVFLAWFSDVTDILGSHDIGFALWNFRGSFGILDSGREDVDYEDWYGHKLDRKLLDLILKA